MISSFLNSFHMLLEGHRFYNVLKTSNNTFLSVIRSWINRRLDSPKWRSVPLQQISITIRRTKTTWNRRNRPELRQRSHSTEVIDYFFITHMRNDSIRSSAAYMRNMTKSFRIHRLWILIWWSVIVIAEMPGQSWYVSDHNNLYWRTNKGKVNGSDYPSRGCLFSNLTWILSNWLERKKRKRLNTTDTIKTAQSWDLAGWIKFDEEIYHLEHTSTITAFLLNHYIDQTVIELHE